MPTKTEASEQEAVIQFCEYCGIDIVHIPNEGKRSARYAKKGNKVAVSGSIELRNYENSDGEKKLAVDIVAQEVEFLTPRSSDSYGDEVGHDVPKGNSHRTQLEVFDDDSDIPF